MLSVLQSMPSPITQPQEFVWTWNIFLTLIIGIMLPIVSTMIVYSLKRHINQRDKERDKKDEKISELLEEREAVKEKSIQERWDKFTKTQCDIKNAVDEITTALAKKLDVELHDEVCGKHMEIIWERLDHHSHNEKGDVTIPLSGRR